MKTSIELTLDQARAVAVDIGKSELSRRAGIPYASLHDLLRVGVGNRSLANLAALERALRAYGGEDNATYPQGEQGKVNDVVNEGGS